MKENGAVVDVSFYCDSLVLLHRSPKQEEVHGVREGWDSDDVSYVYVSLELTDVLLWSSKIALRLYRMMTILYPLTLILFCSFHAHLKTIAQVVL